MRERDREEVSSFSPCTPSSSHLLADDDNDWCCYFSCLCCSVFFTSLASAAADDTASGWALGLPATGVGCVTAAGAVE